MRFNNQTIALFIVLSFIGLLPKVEAQTERPLKAVKFRLMSWASPLEGLHFESAGKVQSIDEVVPHARSRPYSFVGNGDLNLFTISQDSDGKEVRKIVASVPYAGLENNMLLLINEVSNPYKVRTLAESVLKFPSGSFRLISFSNLPVKVGIGTEPYDLPPNGEVIAKPKTLKTGDVFPLRIVATGDQGLELVYSNRWLYSDKERVMLFVDRGAAQENQGLIVKCFTEDYNPEHDKPPELPKESGDQ